MGTYGVESNKYTKLKAFDVEGGKYVKLAKAFVVENGKYVKLWSGFTPMFVQVTRDTNVYPYEGLIRYSENGQIWTTLDMDLGNSSDNYLYYNSIAFGNDVYVASFYGGYLAYSTDGITWTKVTTLQSGSQTTYYTTRVFFCNGKFIAFVYQETPYVNVYYYVYTSTDGKNWTYAKSFANLGGSGGVNRYVSSLVYGKLSESGDKVYIALVEGCIYYSSDLATWTLWKEKIYGMHMKSGCDYPFFIRGSSGYYYNDYHQYTGSTITEWRTGNGFSSYQRITSVFNEDDNTIYYYGGDGGGYLWKWDISATDGNCYTTTQGGWIPSTSMPINAVHGNGLFVGYTTSNMVYSTDGQTWTIATGAVSDKQHSQICFGSE